MRKTDPTYFIALPSMFDWVSVKDRGRQKLFQPISLAIYDAGGEAYNKVEEEMTMAFLHLLVC